MKVILLEKISKLGNLGEEIIVKSGFARNFLFPKYKAIISNKKNRLFFQNKLKEIEKNNIINIEKTKEKEKIINELSLVIKSKCSDKGKLFGSITNKNISSLLESHNVYVQKSDIDTQGIINQLGKYEILINLKNNIKIKKEISIVQE